MKKKENIMLSERERSNETSKEQAVPAEAEGEMREQEVTDECASCNCTYLSHSSRVGAFLEIS